MAEFDVDLFVIGAGSGGTRAARIAAGHGARVMIAEEDRIGGTCVIRGCVPKKLFVYASRFADDFEDAAGFGWTLPGTPSFDWPTLRDAVANEVTRLSGLYRKGLEGAKVEIREERAVIEGPHAVRLQRSGEVVTARHILVATGGWPSFDPPIPGGELGISSNEVFHLPTLPKRLLVVGGGYIALEFASLFARLGVAVTVLHRGDNILRGFDEDIRNRLRDALKEAGIAFRLGCTIERIEELPDGARRAHCATGAPIEADVVLVATGRRPNTRGLGLEKAGVRLGALGEIAVDAASASSVASIHAVGDVTNRVNLTPVAIREGHAFADSVFGGKTWTVDHGTIASAVFTTPEVGTVGLTEAQAVAAGHELRVFESGFRPMKATISGRHERIYMKLVIDAKTDKVLGVHILGHDAGEIVQAAAIAVTMGATKADFDRTVALHPSAAEELVTMRTPRAS
ncbi:MAG: glutathione-disulfide reductase [Bosea sp.]|uniref:glutathione-disulfide reductase n=1 Tax=unclassified Bosea (in: a-proteobacteria) TaxID=2653178 RepID=UPI00095C935F|nr:MULTISPECIES: glutathione-disulfide reductase [unclassified Bosea (in: a-proteobacteria)]MBN9456568.1 glutathione-disulfide reductase [Bosea sp. (in: a-proteobacteria)]OJV08809.1 MAG: glutathione-disulfide reductase [Bosea sp. 67-29]